MKAISALIMLLPGSAFAADYLCGNSELSQLTARELAKSAIAQVVEADTEAAAPAAPKTNQATAPASAGGTSAVDSPERPRWLSLAIEQGLAKENDQGGVTISISPFDWLLASAPDGHFDDNGNFVATRDLRRLTGSLTVGNRGVALDSDGDGVAEDPADAKSLDDSLLLDIQYRFYGSRERRDIVVDRRYLEQQQGIALAASRLADKAAGLVGDEEFDTAISAQLDADAPPITEPECKAAAKVVAASLQHRVDLKNQAVELQALRESISSNVDELVKKVDGSLVMSVGISMLDRKEYLGPDRVGVTLRGVKGFPDTSDPTAGESLVFNLGYFSQEALVDGSKRMRGASLGVEFVDELNASLRFGQGRWAVSLAAEKNWEAPANAKKSQALLGLRYEVPVSDSITVPFSLKWSNRNELLQDESEVVGHVGFSINFDSLLARD